MGEEKMSSLQATSNPHTEQGFDEPLSDPTGDLLDMDEHAEALARYIQQHEHQLPFTVGIFGEWGEGKTTLVRFLRHHLSRAERYSPDHPIKFVSFSAWAYTTSEKLWRAMILEIAQVLYKQKQAGAAGNGEEIQVKPPAEPNGWLPSIGRFLTGDAFVLRDSLPERNEYEDKVRELASTDFGKITRRTPNTELNQQATIAAVVNSALAVLGTVSPLVAGLRSLFGLEPKIDAANLMQTEAGESSSNAIEALPRFQQIFREMLDEKAKDEPVYVFIDDLDRAQPDVALDIMESVRIALSEVRCIFIIAVDESLISQGLRLRYKELFANESSGAFANKGQDYLEKIIQFRMRVPPRTAEQTQRLIAAEFPHWMPAGDIIQSIAGNNPRRVKQYCQRLRFQDMIGLSPFTLGAGHAEEVLAAAPEPGPARALNAGATISGNREPEIVYLARKLRESFDEHGLNNLFLTIGEDRNEYPPNLGDRIEKLLLVLQKKGMINELKDAMLGMQPDLFRDVSAPQSQAGPTPANTWHTKEPEIVYLARKLRESFDEPALNNLFLTIGEDRNEYPPNLGDRIEKLLLVLQKKGMINELKDAMLGMQPDVFDDADDSSTDVQYKDV
jgi:hypothetical protein